MTVVTPLRKDYLKQAAANPRHAAIAAENSKDTKFLELCKAEGLYFEPLAFESFGRWGETTEDCLISLSGRIAETQNRTLSSVLHQLATQIAVALQRGNARCISERQRVLCVPNWSFPAEP